MAQEKVNMFLRENSYHQRNKASELRAATKCMGRKVN